MDEEENYSDSYEENLSNSDSDLEEEIIEVCNPDIEDNLQFMEHYEKNKKNYKTLPVLSKYEKTRILSERAQQIENGSEPYISNVERFNSSYAIAIEEFNTYKIPFIIRRNIPNSDECEYWKLKDMIY